MSPGAGGFRHEALLYAGTDGFLDATVPFIRDGVAAREPTLVVVAAERIAALRHRLGPDAGPVSFADMGTVGANPARIIPAWTQFVAEHGDRGPLRGIGEPVGPERSDAEIVECQRHEALLNLAFAEIPDFWLLCPYDTQSLSADVVLQAHRSHPVVAHLGTRHRSAAFREVIPGAFDAPLPDPPGEAAHLAFSARSLRVVRRFVARYARRAGLATAQTHELVLAAHEVATNSLRYGGGHGAVRVWTEDDTFVCEIRDSGRITEPLAGRQPPAPEALGGRGLWMVNQLCDLSQFRSFDDGTVVRLHMRRR